jgi:hypothetical protein
MSSFRRVGGAGILVCVVGAAAACGGSSTKAIGPVAQAPTATAAAAPSPSQSPSPSPAPSPSSTFDIVALPSPAPLPNAFASINEMSLHIGLSGKWRTSSFQPSLSFVAPKLAFPFTAQVDVPDFVYLTSNEPQAVALVRPSGVFEQGTDPAALPKDLIFWLKGNPHLQSGATSKIVVGGLNGTQFDAVVTSLPSAQPSDCVSNGIQCLPIAYDSDGVLLYLKGEKVRFIVLDAGEGPPMLITIEALPSAFDVFSRAAMRLVASIAFASKSG